MRGPGGPGRRTTWRCARGVDTSPAYFLRFGAAPGPAPPPMAPPGHPARLFCRVAASKLHRCAAGRGLEAPPLVRKSPRLVCAGAVCWPPAPPWSRSRTCLSWRWRAALRQGGGVYLPPALALQGPASSMALALAAAGVLYVVLTLLLDTRYCGSFSPCPLAPCPPLGGGGKRGMTGRKIVTKETQEGC